MPQDWIACPSTFPLLQRTCWKDHSLLHPPPTINRSTWVNSTMFILTFWESTAYDSPIVGVEDPPCCCCWSDDNAWRKLSISNDRSVLLVVPCDDKLPGSFISSESCPWSNCCCCCCCLVIRLSRSLALRRWLDVNRRNVLAAYQSDKHFHVYKRQKHTIASWAYCIALWNWLAAIAWASAALAHSSLSS